MNVSESARSVTTHVEALLGTKVSDVSKKELRQSLDGLKSALADVQNFVDNIEGVADFVTTGRGRRAPGKRGRRRGRSPDDFPVSDFILKSLRENTRGLRPAELRDMMTALVPGKHSQPSATISTTLTRLKKKGIVRNKGGVWKLARRAAK